MNAEKSIKKLTLNNLRMSKLALNELCKVMASSTMTEIDISMNGLFHGAISHLLKRRPILGTETFDNTTESEGEDDDEGEGEEENNLEEAVENLEQDKSRTTKSVLQTQSTGFKSSLNIGQERIISSISQMILNSGSLIHMNLNETGIQGEALRILIVNVMKSFSLCSLHLCGNNIPFEDYEFICQTMNLSKYNTLSISMEDNKDQESIPADIPIATIEENEYKNNLIITRIIGQSLLTTNLKDWKEICDCWICSKYALTIIFWTIGYNDPPPKIKGEFTENLYEAMVPISDYCISIDKSFKSNMHANSRPTRDKETSKDLSSSDKLLQQAKLRYEKLWNLTFDANIKYKPYYVNYPTSYESNSKVYVYCSLIKPTKQKYYVQWKQTVECVRLDGTIEKKIIIRNEDDYIHPPSRTESIAPDY